jgi:hypothetical protein
MADGDFADVLLKAGGISVLTPEQQIGAVLARDARRVRRLTWLTVGIWVVTATLSVLIFSLMYGPITSFSFNVKGELEHELNGKKYTERTVAERVLGRFLFIHTQHVFATTLLASAVVLLALSALGTVILVHASRRATLRQISVSLQLISEQLRQIQAAQAKPPVSG